MELSWLDLPFTLLTLLLATRLAYDYYGVVAATFTGSFSLQIFLFYCFARWYRHTIATRSAAAGDGAGPPAAEEEGEASPPVLTSLLESGGGGAARGAAASLANRCFAVVFMVFVPLVIVVFERSQADVVAYALCLANIIVMVLWLSPDAAADSVSAATKSFLRLSDDEDDEGSGSGGGAGAGGEDKCCVCLAAMREQGQALRDLPRCGHRFHAKCIGKWLTAHPTCPVCRATAAPPPTAAGDDHADDVISPV
uniref:RING-type E3 ubiquitin transferase n=1 Tax=Leersia perrieri TaxID=77586 RepID=A0A0D9WQY2_9ORYZ